MQVAQIIQLILSVVAQLLPLVEQLKSLAAATSVSADDMAKINADLKAAHDRLGKLLGVM